MERIGTFKPFCEFEDELLRQGELPDRVALGAWRPLQPGEVVDPRHIEDVNGVESIPARLYGNAHRTAENAIPVLAEPSEETQPVMLVANTFALAGR